MKIPLVMALSCGLLAGCFAVSPQLDPHDPPPNVPPGMLLLQVPDAVSDALADQAVLALRDRALADEDSGQLTVDAERARQIRAHQVVTGMSTQEVIWAFGCHPSRVRDQGPPGGHTLLWELPRSLVGGWVGAGGGGNFWVRLNDAGLVAAAGRN